MSIFVTLILVPLVTISALEGLDFEMDLKIILNIFKVGESETMEAYTILVSY